MKAIKKADRIELDGGETLVLRYTQGDMSAIQLELHDTRSSTTVLSVETLSHKLEMSGEDMMALSLYFSEVYHDNRGDKR